MLQRQRLQRDPRLRQQRLTVAPGDLPARPDRPDLVLRRKRDALRRIGTKQRSNQKPWRGGPNAGRPSFGKGASGGRKPNPANLLAGLQATAALLRRLIVLRNRLERDQARDDKRQWVQDRRARTRHLIELGGLVQKAGLVELTDDDRATLLGAFLGIADQLRGDTGSDAAPADLRARWRRRGLRAFDADRDEAAATSMGTRKEVGHPEREARE